MPARERTSIRIDASSVVLACAVTIVLLALAHTLFQWLRFERGMPEAYGFVRMFDLAAEANLPSFFSALQIVACAALAAAIGMARHAAKDRFARHWLLLAVLLFALAADESAEIHELTIRPMRELFPSTSTGLLFWGWVVPALVLVALVGISYLRFVFAYLPPPTRNACVLGAVLFVGGAVGVEMPEARHFQAHGDRNMTYAMFALAEEVLEMLGMLVLLRGLMRHFASEVGAIELRVGVRAARTAPAGARRREPGLEPSRQGRGFGALPARYLDTAPGAVPERVDPDRRSGAPLAEMRADVRTLRRTD